MWTTNVHINYDFILSKSLNSPNPEVDLGGAQGMLVPLFLQLSFSMITLKNYKLCLLKLNWSLITHLTYVYPNTIKTSLTTKHLLFDRQLLCYSYITSTSVKNLTVLSSTADKVNRISNQFWLRWKHKYDVKLCETIRHEKYFPVLPEF